MAEDELLMFVFLIGYVTVFLPLWFWRTWVQAWPGAPVPLRTTLVLSPVACVFLLFVLLKSFASSDVREDADYLLFYALLGFLWVDTGLRLLHWLNLSARDDALHRRNKAASLALIGAAVGITLSFAGANFGEGPSFWVVLFCGLISTGTLFLAWYVLDRMTRISDTLTIDRDVAAGYRAAGVFVGLGLVLGRAVAGNWISIEATLRDFAIQALPVVPMLLIAMVLEARYPPRPAPTEEQIAQDGMFPALILPAIGVVVVSIFGHW